MKTKLTYDCKKIAEGRALDCAGSAKLPELGALEEVSLVGYDPESKQVHMMTVNSQGEFHDHRGGWKDERTLELEVEGTLAGKPMKERITFQFGEKGEATYRSVMTLEGGAAMTVEGRGRRVGKG